MPSDARILREQGREALREHWRQKARLHTERYPGWWRSRPYEPRLRKPRPRAAAACPQCGGSFDKWESPGKIFCSAACRRADGQLRRLTGKACTIRVQPCGECGHPFTQHGQAVKYCSAECLRSHNRTYSRNYQRRTRVTAIRYWTVDQTPEARALAQTYFQLRQSLRRHRNGYL